MCTSMAMPGKTFCFGRNLDLECGFGERVALTPRGCPLEFKRLGKLENHYAILGMAAMRGETALYADAFNEKGLCIAGLNFPEDAVYCRDVPKNQRAVAPHELPLWLLGRCATLRQAKEELSRLTLADSPFDEETPCTPMHWHIADETGSAVLEATREGMRVWENPANVLTNSPPFDFQMLHLRQYLNVTADEPISRFADALTLEPFGRGMGAAGLPGDYSPPSRFVRAAFVLANGGRIPEGCDRVLHFFHLLEAVAMPYGSVMTQAGPEYTRYSCCMTQGTYIYKTYDSCRMTAIDMFKEDLDGAKPVVFEAAGSRQMQRQGSAESCRA